MLTALVSATKAPVLLAPGMNTNMWQSPANQRNLETLFVVRISVCRSDVRAVSLPDGRGGEDGGTRNDRGGRPRSVAREEVRGRKEYPDHRRADTRADRRRSLHLESLVRKDGLCARSRGAGSRRSVTLVSGPVALQAPVLRSWFWLRRQRRCTTKPSRGSMPRIS